MNTIVKSPDLAEESSSSGAATDGGGEVDDFKPLSAEEAQQWRQTQVRISIGRVLVWQLAAMCLAGLLAWVLTGASAAGWSAAYGGGAILVPSAVMAWGVSAGRLSKMLSVFARGSLAAVVFWEGVKVLLTIVLLALAPKLVVNLSWLALVAGFVLVLKVYWLAFFVSSRTLK